MIYPPSELVIDPVLIRKYDISGPRYTSYPTADRFVEAFGEATYRYWLSSRNIGGIINPLSLYLHVPFCSNVCFYCACNKQVTRDRSKAVQYVKYLQREVQLTADLLDDNREVSQVHWGGGTPTYLSRDDTRSLCKMLSAKFDIAPDSEYSIEVDPREIQPDSMAFLAELGFNRVSLGVQDFDPAVQKAIHRVQPVEMTGRVTEAARTATPTLTPTATSEPACVGDCDDDHRVTVAELVTGVNIALDRATVAACTALDRDNDQRVTIAELVAAVSRALEGC